MSVLQEQTFELIGRDGNRECITAAKLGAGTSQRAVNPKPRWFEVGIYKDLRTNEYVVHTMGKSTVPGENTYARIVRTSSAYTVVELLTVFSKAQPGVGAYKYIPRASSLALAEGAMLDDDLQDAYVNRVG